VPTADKARRLPRWIVAAAACLAMLAAWGYASNPLTGQARAYAEEVAKASAATYVSLRTLNAFLSTAQEVEVGGNALVVSGTAQPFKMLEPIDDTIERIAGAVFAIMVATGVLSVALGPVSGTGWALVGLAALLWLVFPGRLGGLPRRLGVYGGFLGLALPLAFVLASFLAERMTAQVWAGHQAIIAEITATVAGDELPPPGEGGWWQSLQERLGGIDRYQTVASALYSNADAVIGSYIAILSVFIFRILLLPVLLVGAFWVATRQLAA
jgi:hypothetical protein